MPGVPIFVSALFFCFLGICILANLELFHLPKVSSFPTAIAESGEGGWESEVGKLAEQHSMAPSISGGHMYTHSTTVGSDVQGEKEHEGLREAGKLGGVKAQSSWAFALCFRNVTVMVPIQPGCSCLPNDEYQQQEHSNSDTLVQKQHHHQQQQRWGRRQRQHTSKCCTKKFQKILDNVSGVTFPCERFSRPCQGSEVLLALPYIILQPGAG
eukprot:1147439-Pelagomonas_calceolata.AAC.3